jgi:hypothetical protein
MYRYGGHGRNDHLMCRGAYEYRCWNGVTVDGPDAGRRLAAAILTEIEGIPAFSVELQRLVHEELQKRSSSRGERVVAFQREFDALSRQVDNIIAFVRDGQGSSALRDELTTLERRRSDVAARQHEAAEELADLPDLPDIDVIKRMAREEMARQTDEPYEFARIMRRLIPHIVVRPFRLCDGGGIVLRADFTLDLSGLLSKSQRHPALVSELRRAIVVDLFDPPQRAAFRQEVLSLRATGLSEKVVAKRLGITITAAQRAAALDRRMRELGIDDPYVEVMEPPEDIVRLRRHRHPRYQFRPFDDLK